MRLALALIALAACYRSQFETCAVRCGPGGACPAGMACLADGICHAAGDEGLCDLTTPMDDAAVPQHCMGDTCNTPPSQCHAAHGTCIDERCVYAFADGASCTGAIPATACVGGALRTYHGPGACAAGACEFPFTDQACLAGCSGQSCNTPQQCDDVCARLSECGLTISGCRTKCRDRCTMAELNQLAVCAGAACVQISQCIDLVSCLP